MVEDLALGVGEPVEAEIHSTVERFPDGAYTWRTWYIDPQRRITKILEPKFAADGSYLQEALRRPDGRHRQAHCCWSRPPATLARTEHHREGTAVAAHGKRERRAYIGSFTTEGGPGVLVAAVRRGSPAAAAGVRRGDIILGVGGRPTASLGELADVLAQASGSIRLDLLRGGRQLALVIE